MHPPSTSDAPREQWHTKEANDIFAILRTQRKGLSREEAQQRLKEIGLNALPEEKQKSLLRIFFEQFTSPLINILIVADVIVFLLREFTDAYIILGILLFNSILGTIQEGRAQHTLEALKHFVTTDAEVLRDNTKTTIPDTNVVPGDIILLQEGEKIPADARVLEANSLTLEEAALTGESSPVRKFTAALPEGKLPIAEQKNMVFKGTTIATGYGTAVVTATGLHTVIGGISQTIASIDTEIPLTKNLRELSRVVVLVVIILVVVLFTLGVAEGKDVTEMFLAAVAIAIAAVPEGLPLVLTVVLAAGVWRMAKRRVLVKKLQAVESLGQANVIAVDKTGTITKNEMTIRTVIVGEKTFPISGVGYEPMPRIENPSKELELAATIAVCCANAHISIASETDTYRVAGDPTEGAMAVFGEKTGITRDTLTSHRLIQDWPFDYEKKYHVALYTTDKGPVLAITGAPEIILDRAGTFLSGKGTTDALTSEERKRFEDQFLALSAQGMRVIAFGFLWNAPESMESNDAVPAFTFGGFYIMQDPLRPNIEHQITRARDAGIRVIMITGDHALTANAIAIQAGIQTDGELIMTGRELDDMPEATRNEHILRTNVFARVTPDHKVAIIEAYKAKGEIIAMTGDGVNDAPSLVAADLGIAMGRIGTEVTKEAADLILLDDNFEDILTAIEEGRNLRQGIRRTITYLFSSNLGEIFVIAVALLVKVPLPLLAAQIIWMNLVTDTFFDISLALEPKDPSLMRKGAIIPKKLFDGLIVKRLLLIAPVLAAGVLFLYFRTYSADIVKARSLALMGLAIFQWVNALNCRSETKSVFQLNPFSNLFLLGTLVWVAILQGIAFYTPFMNQLLRTVPLSFNDIGSILILSLPVLFVEEIRKFFARRAAVAVTDIRVHT